MLEEWEKSFRLFYSEIEKFRKKIHFQGALRGVSTTSTQSKRLIIDKKTRFNENYKII